MAPFSPLLRHLLSENRIWFARGDGGRAVSSSEPEAHFNLPSIDSLHALPFGHLHEWSFDNQLSAKARNSWYPPTSVTCNLLGETLSYSANESLLRQKSLVAWIGRRIWPTPHHLQLTLPEQAAPLWSWRSHTMFLDPHDKEERLWSIIQLLTSPAVFGVFADGSGLNFIATRRLQLAAQRGGSLCFLFRPPWELERVSCAHSRWKVTPVGEGFQKRNGEVYERWTIELVSGKGLPTPIRWEVERKEGKQSRFDLVEKPPGTDEDGRELHAESKSTVGFDGTRKRIVA